MSEDCKESRKRKTSPMDLVPGSQIIFQYSPHPTAWALAFSSAALLLIKHCAHDLNFLSVFTEVIVIVHRKSRTRGQWKHRGGWPTEIKQGPGLALNIQYVKNYQNTGLGPAHWRTLSVSKVIWCFVTISFQAVFATDFSVSGFLSGPSSLLPSALTCSIKGISFVQLNH